MTSQIPQKVSLSLSNATAPRSLYFFLRYQVTFPVPSEIGHAIESSRWRKQGEFLEEIALRLSLLAGLAGIGRSCKFTDLIPGARLPHSRRPESLMLHDWEFERHRSRSTP